MKTALIIRRLSVWILLASAAGTGASILALSSLRIEHSQEKYSPPPDDPVVREVEAFRELFGKRTLLVAALDFEEPIDERDVDLIRRLTERIRQMPGVASVHGLTDARRILWSLYRPYSVPAIGTDGIDRNDLERLKSLVRDTPVYASGLVSSDWKTVGLVIALMKDEADGREIRQADLALTIQSHLGQASEGRFEVFMTGMPLMNRAFQDASKRDVRVFGWLSILFVIAFLLVLFRQWRPVVLAGLTATVSLIWTLGLLAATDTPISASLAMVVPLVLVISVAFSVHYLVHFFDGTPDGPRPSTATDRFDKTIDTVFTPSVLTGVTTVTGFLTLAASHLESIRETGLFLAAGVLLSMIASSVVLPAILTIPFVSGPGTRRIIGFPRRFIEALSAMVCHRARLIVAVATAVVVIALAGAVSLRFDANPMRYFASDSPLRRSNEVVGAKLGGSLPIEVLIRRSVTDLDGLVPLILRVEAKLRGDAEIKHVASAVDFLNLAEESRPPSAPPVYNLETGAFPLGTWRRLAADNALNTYVAEDSGSLFVRLATRTNVSDSEALRALMERVEEIVRGEVEGEVSITGLVPLLLRTQQNLIDSQLSSFGLAFLIILGLVFVFVRSWILGLTAGVANLVPIIMVVGFMGWLGIPLDIASVMIASVALGIIVDDTIHFLYHFRRQYQSNSDLELAIQATYAVAGVPLVLTTLVFVGGFLVLTPSLFQPTRTFGLLSAFTIAAAFAADLLLLPALLASLSGGRNTGNGP